MATRPRSRYWFVLLLLVVVAASGIWCVRRVGRWLVVQDTLEPADAIAVLSGRMPERDVGAAQLYRESLAPRVGLTRPVDPGAELAQMDIPFVSEVSYSERVLMHFGVPASAIHILEPAIANTADEIDVIASQAKRDSASKVIIVTTKAHTRRVRAIWHKRVGRSPRAIVRYASGDDFDPEHWWRRTRDALDVLREAFGLANTWAGFPVKPAA